MAVLPLGIFYNRNRVKREKALATAQGFRFGSYFSNSASNKRLLTSQYMALTSLYRVQSYRVCIE